MQPRVEEWVRSHVGLGELSDHVAGLVSSLVVLAGAGGDALVVGEGLDGDGLDGGHSHEEDEEEDQDGPPETDPHAREVALLGELDHDCN